jgi:hypothetical protein
LKFWENSTEKEGKKKVDFTLEKQKNSNFVSISLSKNVEILPAKKLLLKGRGKTHYVGIWYNPYFSLGQNVRN